MFHRKDFIPTKPYAKLGEYNVELDLSDSHRKVNRSGPWRTIGTVTLALGRNRNLQGSLHLLHDNAIYDIRVLEDLKSVRDGRNVESRRGHASRTSPQNTSAIMMVPSSHDLTGFPAWEEEDLEVIYNINYPRTIEGYSIFCGVFTNPRHAVVERVSSMEQQIHRKHVAKARYGSDTDGGLPRRYSYALQVLPFSSSGVPSAYFLRTPRTGVWSMATMVVHMPV
ncbi:hypothetical protein EDD16DRAFT_1526187 [Pisolithus croceorrhizus]|nr:hypothetical protein EDD16DRAFT_1526187 [Pisolithus croceorrhizus]